MVKILLMVMFLSLSAFGAEPREPTQPAIIPRVKGFDTFLEKVIRSPKLQKQVDKLVEKNGPHRKETIEYYYELDSTYASIGVAPPDSKDDKGSERLKYMYDLFFMEKAKK